MEPACRAAARITPFPCASMMIHLFQVSTITSVRGVALEGDVVRLLQSIPGHTKLSVHVSRRTGTSAGAVFALDGIESVRAKLAATCKWPRAIAKPNN